MSKPIGSNHQKPREHFRLDNDDKYVTSKVYADFAVRYNINNLEKEEQKKNPNFKFSDFDKEIKFIKEREQNDKLTDSEIYQKYPAFIYRKALNDDIKEHPNKYLLISKDGSPINIPPIRSKPMMRANTSPSPNIKPRGRMDDFSLGDRKNYINSKTYADIVIELNIRKNHDVTKLTADQIKQMKQEKMDEITKKHGGNPYVLYPRTRYAEQVRDVVSKNKSALKGRIFTQEELKQRLAKKQTQAVRTPNVKRRIGGISNYRLGNGKAITAENYVKTIIERTVDQRMPDDGRLESIQSRQRQIVKEKELTEAMKLSNNAFYKKYPPSKYGNLVKNDIKQNPNFYKILPVKEPRARGGPQTKPKHFYHGG